MTNSWSMLFDYKYGEDRPVTDTASDVFEYLGGHPDDPEMNFNFAAAAPVSASVGEDVITFEIPNDDNVVITENSSPKDNTFWKYNEGKILREIEDYLSGTYKGHYVSDGTDEAKIQTLDLIDSIGDAEAFCRSNAIKYLSRFGKKNGKNRLDILKVIHYAILLYHFSDLPITSDETLSDTHSPLGY